MGNRSKRLTGRRLQARRQRWFEANPLCVSCEAKGRWTPATELDHITPLHKGGSDTSINWQGLCKACHWIKTQVDCGYKERLRIGVDGWPEGGV